jgi:hypothetical protein
VVSAVYVSKTVRSNSLLLMNRRVAFSSTSEVPVAAMSSKSSTPPSASYATEDRPSEQVSTTSELPISPSSYVTEGLPSEQVSTTQSSSNDGIAERYLPMSDLDTDMDDVLHPSEDSTLGDNDIVMDNPDDDQGRRRAHTSSINGQQQIDTGRQAYSVPPVDCHPAAGITQANEGTEPEIDTVEGTESEIDTVNANNCHSSGPRVSRSFLKHPLNAKKKRREPPTTSKGNVSQRLKRRRARDDDSDEFDSDTAVNTTMGHSQDFPTVVDIQGIVSSSLLPYFVIHPYFSA